MTTSIKLKKSSIAGRIPSTSDLDYGELAINYADGILYFKNSSNQVSSVNARALGVDSTATFSIIDSAYINAIRPAESIFNVSSSGSSAYTFGGDGFSSNRNNPTLYLTRGKTYKFVMAVSGHPFQIRVSNNGSAYNTGVTNNGAQTGDLLFTPDMNAPTSLVYQCTLHSGMVGNIVILDDTDAVGLDSALASQLINSSYIQSRQIKYTNNDFADSAFVTTQINLIDSSYIESRQIKYTNNDFADSAFVTTQINLIDSSYIQLRQTTNPTGVDSSATINLIDSSYIQLRQTTNPTGVDSAATIAIVDSSYIQLRQTTNPTGVDSAATIALVDSSYIQSRQTTTPVGVDSSATINLIDSSHIQNRQIKYTNNDFADSAFVTTQINNLIDAAPGALNTLNELASAIGDDASFSTTITNSIATKLTSAQTTVLIDSAYVQLRQINNPTGVDSAATIDLVDSAYVQLRQINNPTGVDSAATIALVDSAYIQSRQTTTPSGVDSAATIALVDSAYVNAFTIDANTLNGQNASYYLDYGNLNNVPSEFTDSSTVDSIILNIVDSAYVQTRFGTLRESNNSLVVSGNIIPETDSAFSLGTAQKKFKDLHLSGGTVFLDNLALSADPVNQRINIGRLDSNNTVNVIGVIATVDSAGVSAIVDSAFLEARLGDFVSETELTSKNFTTFDSANATSVIDSSYINSLNANAGALNGQNGAFYSDYRNLTNKPEGGIDYGTVVASATSAIDILDILISQTTIDYGTIGSPGGLISNYGTL